MLGMPDSFDVFEETYRSALGAGNRRSEMRRSLSLVPNEKSCPSPSKDNTSRSCNQKMGTFSISQHLKDQTDDTDFVCKRFCIVAQVL